MNTSWVARYVEGDGLWGISEPFWLVPLLPWIWASRFALLSIGRLALLLRPRPNLRPPLGEKTGRASPHHSSPSSAKGRVGVGLALGSKQNSALCLARAAHIVTAVGDQFDLSIFAVEKENQLGRCNGIGFDHTFIKVFPTCAVEADQAICIAGDVAC